MHHAHEFQSRSVDDNTSLFECFPGCCRSRALVTIEVARRHAVVAVLVTGVRTPEEQYRTFPHEEDVHCNLGTKSLAHGVVLAPGKLSSSSSKRSKRSAASSNAFGKNARTV